MPKFPDRKILRERARQARRERRRKEVMLSKCNSWGYPDLTPFNAAGRMLNKEFELKLK
ncbi:hypothetical protein HKBW3S43_01447 [Candidatus Hakubella thermalkaliphila]|uniref:Uncharacterized protein n=1 Tax=Candidatus Hakubella thermalkaliphila TaxID=2754717 RepID=A0A6V8PTC8_9ACTN|nr:hypothetical protein [Candidatus Hakubella thermalkaliphila]GFP35658.1 hypothetical protein HKBW3S43_01447 [Candidatus Hakubella thermalkaliphila]